MASLQDDDRESGDTLDPLISPLRQALAMVCEHVLQTDVKKVLILVKEHMKRQDYEKLSEKSEIDLHDIVMKLEDRGGFDHMITLLEQALADTHVDQGSISVPELFAECKEKYARWLKHKGIEKEDGFVGRRSQIDQVISCLQDTHIKGVCICGMGGVGKSSLAKRTCFELGYRVIHVELRSVTTMRGFLQIILHHFDKEVMHGMEDEALLTMLAECIKQVKANTILLLDEVDKLMSEKGEQDTFLNKVNEILSDWNNEKVKLLITSRYKMVDPDNHDHRDMRTKIGRFQDDLVEFELKPLSPEEAVMLLKYHAKSVQFTDDDYYSLAKCCGFNPQALKVIAGHLVNTPAVEPGELVRHLHPRNVAVAEKIGLNQVFLEVFNSLDQEYQEYLMCLSVFESSFDINAAAAIMGENIIDAKYCLQFLKCRHLVEIDSLDAFPGRLKSERSENRLMHTRYSYSLHALVQSFLGELAHTGRIIWAGEARDKAVQRFVKFYEERLHEIAKCGRSNCVEMMKRIHTESSHIMKMISLPPKYRSTRDITKKKEISTLHYIHLVFETFMSCHQRMEYFCREAEKAEKGGDMLSACFHKLWQIDQYIQMDKNNWAKQELTSLEPKIKNLYDQQNRDHGTVITYALYKFTEGRLLMYMQKNYDGALETLKESKRLYGQVVKDQPILYARVANMIGAVYFDQKNYTSALERYTEAYNLISKSVREDRHFDIPNFLMNVAAAHHSLGQECEDRDQVEAQKKYKKAVNYYERTLNIEKKLSLYGMSATARTLKNLAVGYMHLRDLPKALLVAKEARDLAEKKFQRGHVFPIRAKIFEGHVLVNMAKKEIETQTGQSMKYLQEASTLYEITLQDVISASCGGGLPPDDFEFKHFEDDYLYVLNKRGLTREVEKVKRILEDYKRRRYSDNPVSDASGGSDMEAFDSFSSTSSGSPESTSGNISAAATQVHADESMHGIADSTTQPKPSVETASGQPTAMEVTDVSIPGNADSTTQQQQLSDDSVTEQLSVMEVTGARPRKKRKHDDDNSE